MVAVKGRKSSSKNPPIFSHEFVIQNHADIVSCMAMVFVIGLMVQVTSPWAYTFIGIHHNVSTSQLDDPMAPLKYTTGWKDSCAVFFYFLITIIMHAIFQEYIFDKISKRLHLSKVKLAKFNESSQLIIFYLLSVVWGIDIIVRDNLISNVTSLWEDYPAPMSFFLKLFFIVQMAYWLHCYPELYFQRVKREDIPPRLVQATFGFLFTFAAYFLNFQQVGVMMLILHYIGDAMQHGARITHFVNQKQKVTKLSFMIANSVYVVVRIAVLALAGLVFLYGFTQVESSFDYAAGSFNIPAIQYPTLCVISGFEIYLLYAFAMRQVKRARENAAPVVVKPKPKQKPRKKEAKSSKKSAASEDDDLPEVDQATKKNLRSRPAAKAK